MAEYAAAAITALTATAAIVGSTGAYRQQERIYRGWGSDEDSPWQPWRPRQRPPFSNSRSRHTYGYHGQPPPSLHEHIHHVECPGSQCHYRAFLTDSIQRYNESRRSLRQTYLWNLRELSHIHASQPQKSAHDKAVETERLYTYYVSRVRSVFEDHRRDHRRLFGQDYLCWAAPEREDPAGLRSRMGSPGTGAGAGNVNVREIIRGTPVIEEGREEEGTDCEEGGGGGGGEVGEDGNDCKDCKDGKSGHRGSRGSRRKNRSKTKSASAD